MPAKNKLALAAIANLKPSLDKNDKQAEYAYLKKNIIKCIENKDCFIARVQEVYVELLDEMNAQDTCLCLAYSFRFPSAGSIASAIDDENIDAIEIYCNLNGRSYDDSDELIALYYDDTSYMIDEWVPEVLWALGLPVSENYNAGATLCLPCPHAMDKDQIKLEFWREWERV